MLELEDILKALNEASIRYLVVGGVAVALHGPIRFTADLDLLLALDENNLDAMDKVMTSLGYLPRQPISLKELHNADKVRQFFEEKNMLAFTLFHPGQQLLTVDILSEASLRFDEYDARKKMMQMDEIQVPVVDINDLIAMKQSAGRQKDLEDIQRLTKE